MRRFLRFLPIILIVGVFSLGALALYGKYYYDAPGPLAEPTTVLFKKGKGFREIVDDLAEKGVIRNKYLFAAIAILQGDARKFNAGEYQFSAAITPRLIMEMIAEGRVVVHRMIIPEGFRVDEIIALLNEEDTLEGQVSAVLKEGDLLPETYHFVYGDSRGEMIDRMREGMRATMAELWAKRQEGLPFTTPEEALTLASVVEKETGVASERGQVASVFINRLRKGMKLQSDPTVIYGIEKEKGKLGRLLVRDDLVFISPYNTYLVVGLPPSPIANPGRAALEAVLNPPQTDYLYFVATGTGGHNFAAGMKEHVKNVKEYRKARAEAEKAKEKKEAKKK